MKLYHTLKVGIPQGISNYIRSNKRDNGLSSPCCFAPIYRAIAHYITRRLEHVSRLLLFKGRENLFMYKPLSNQIIALILSFFLPTTLHADYVKNNEKEDVVPLAKLHPNFNTGLVQGATVDTGIVLSSDGKVWLWGFKGSGQGGNGKHSEPDLPAKAVNSLENVARIAGGIYHLLALDSNGDLWGWGQSGYGETGCPGTYPNIPCRVLSNVTYMDAGEYWSIALDKSGNIYTWGHNGYGQLGIGIGKGNKNTPQRLNSKLNNEVGVLVGAGYEHGYAVTLNQTTGKYRVWGWGDNEAQALGLSTTSCLGVQNIVYEPIPIPSLDSYAKDITYIAGGNGWGTALLKNGDVIGWGSLLALGQGVTKNTCTSTPIKILSNVEQLYSRYIGSIAITTTSEIYTWGGSISNSSFPMIYGVKVTKRYPAGKPVQIGGGKEHIYYTNTDGEMYGVGYNSRGQTNPNSKEKQDWPGGKIPLDEWLKD
jgi:alpha-tubulin suppressor-like RCC1 family protein